jgi:hypothetical protein
MKGLQLHGSACDTARGGSPVQITFQCVDA